MDLSQVFMTLLKSKDEETQKKCVAGLQALVDCLYWRKKAVSDLTLRERKHISQKTDGFDMNASPTVQIFRRKGWGNIRHALRVEIATIVTEQAGISNVLKREEKRRGDVLFSCLDLYIDQLRDLYDCVDVEYIEREDGEAVTAREGSEEESVGNASVGTKSSSPDDDDDTAGGLPCHSIPSSVTAIVIFSAVYSIGATGENLTTVAVDPKHGRA